MLCTLQRRNLKWRFEVRRGDCHHRWQVDRCEIKVLRGQVARRRRVRLNTVLKRASVNSLFQTAQGRAQHSNEFGAGVNAEDFMQYPWYSSMATRESAEGELAQQVRTQSDNTTVFPPVHLRNLPGGERSSVTLIV
jgi:hypothetical protein